MPPPARHATPFRYSTLCCAQLIFRCELRAYAARRRYVDVMPCVTSDSRAMPAARYALLMPSTHAIRARRRCFHYAAMMLLRRFCASDMRAAFTTDAPRITSHARATRAAQSVE